MLTVWCSHCGSCRAMEQELAGVARDFRGKATVLALSAHPLDGPVAIRNFLEHRHLELEVVRDPQRHFCRLQGLRKTTTTLIWDGEGKLRYFGSFRGGAEAALRELIEGKKVTVPSTMQEGCPISPDLTL